MKRSPGFYFVVGGLILAFSWYGQFGLWVLAAYAVLALVWISQFVTTRWTGELTAVRTGSLASGEIGERLKISVTVTNSGHWRIPWLVLEDCVPVHDLNASPPRLRIEGGWLSIAHLAPSESKTLSYSVECRRRGYFQFGPLLAETGDLYGLHRKYRLLTEPHFVMIFPKVLQLESYDIESPRPVGEVRLAHRLYEDPTRISGVREYAHGDPINRIHWRASARSMTLQSKTFDPSSVAGATIVLNFHQDSFPRETLIHSSELAIILAATLAQALSQLGEQVGFVSNGRDAVERMKFHGWDLQFRTREFAQRGAHLQRDNRRLSPVLVETRRDASQFQRILETLARLELTSEFPFDQMLLEAGPRLPRSASVVVILGDVSAETALALRNLKRAGYSILALIVQSGHADHPNWAAPPESLARLLQEGIPFRTIPDEATVARFCSEHLLRR